MNELTDAEAISRARAITGSSLTGPAHAWRVERLDGAGEVYFLVILGNSSSPSGVCALDAHTGQELSSARLKGNRPHLTVDAAAALKIANIAGGHTRLVWCPCQASMSPLYPFWEIVGSQQTAFVDQQGKRWDHLPMGHA